MPTPTQTSEVLMATAKPALSILVATDLSSGAMEALHSAIAVARSTGAELHVMHAHETPFPRSERGRDLVTVQREVREKRADLATLLTNEVPSDVTVASSRVLEGAPATAILQEARAVKANLIVLGSHRNRGIADRFIGSTAERVLREATVPCLLANGPVSFPLRRMVVASDLSGAARRALDATLVWAREIAADPGAIVGVAHVFSAESHVDLPWAEHDVELNLRKSVANAVREAGSQVQTEVSILRGSDPVSELLDYARNVDAQLIVMGTNSESVLVRAVVGSVSSGMIRRSEIPVLLVPSPAGIGDEEMEQGELLAGGSFRR